MAASQRLHAVSGHLKTPSVMSPSATSHSNGTISFTTFSNIVNGKSRGAKSQHHGISPVTKEELWPVPIATEQDVDDAVEAAAAAFPAWKNTPFDERCELVRKLSDTFMQYEQEFTELLMAETGKPKMFASQYTYHCCWGYSNRRLTLLVKTWRSRAARSGSTITPR